MIESKDLVGDEQSIAEKLIAASAITKTGLGELLLRFENTSRESVREGLLTAEGGAINLALLRDDIDASKPLSDFEIETLINHAKTFGWAANYKYEICAGVESSYGQKHVIYVTPRTQ